MDCSTWRSEGISRGPFVESGTAALEEDCDILIPAAMEGVIHQGNAAKIRAPLIVEAANGPITFASDEIPSSHGKVVLPDMNANAGGVTV